MPSDPREPPVDPKQLPRATLQALERLNEQMESLNDHLISVSSPSTQTRLQSQLESVASRQQSAQRHASMPPIINPAGGVFPPTPTPPRFAYPAPTYPKPIETIPATEVSAKERLKEGGGAWKEAKGRGFKEQLKGFNEGFLNPEKKAREHREGLESLREKNQKSSESSPPSNASPSERGLGSSESHPPNQSRGGIPKSPIAGLSQEEFEKIQTEKAKIPELGDWQLDTYLKMGRDWFARAAGKEMNNNGELSSKGQAFATVSGYLNYAQQHADELHMIGRLYQRAQGFAQNQSSLGAALGYNPNAGMPSSILGFRNPLAMFSEAGKQGMGINWDAWMTAHLGTGLTGEQSKELYSSLAEQGWSNEGAGGPFGLLTTKGNLQTIANNFGAPLMKMGFTSQEVGSFSNALRNGNVGLKVLRENIEGIAVAAHASNETLAAASESLENFANQQEKEKGAPTKNWAIEQGRGFTLATGMNPELLAQAQQSPIYQMMGMTQFGALPQQIGGLSGGSQGELMIHSAKWLMQMASSFAKPKYNSKGEMVETAKAAQEAIASSMSGGTLSPEEIQRLLRNEKQYATSSKIQQMILGPGGFKARLESLKEAEEKHGVHSHQAEVARRLAYTGETPEGKQVGFSWQHSIMPELEKLKVKKSVLEEIKKEHGAEKIKTVEKILEKKNKEHPHEGRSQVEVKFTGLAAKYFEQVKISKAKAKANEGGQSIVESALKFGEGAGEFALEHGFEFAKLLT